jgi:uncharacterized protein with ATP-grasp and redox domains
MMVALLALIVGFSFHLSALENELITTVSVRVVNVELLVRVFSNGQGNFETMEVESDDIVFFFKVKCEVVAAYTGLKKGDLVFGFRGSVFQY